FIPKLQGYDQVQFILIQTGYAAGGSGTYPWLGFRGAGTDGFLSAVAMTLMTGIDNDDFPTRLLRHAGIPGAVFQQFSVHGLFGHLGGNQVVADVTGLSIVFQPAPVSGDSCPL